MMNIVYSYKYMLVENGVIFVIPKCFMEHSPDEASLVVLNDIIYLNICNIYSFLNHDIVRHMEILVDKCDSINISWYYSDMDDFKIEYGFTFSLSRFNCSRIITMYDMEEHRIQQKLAQHPLNIQEVFNGVFEFKI